jgi:anthranilate phosphoribosyltransferase
VLNGKPGPRADAVLFNAAGALVAAGAVETVQDGVERARQAVADGRASRLLDDLRAASRDLADQEAGVGA